MGKIRNLRRDNSGSVVIEFAMLAPALIAMMLGVLQFGLGMQNYNSLRSIAAETARFAVVQRQKGTAYAASNVRTKAISVATAPPYGLISTRLTVTCVNATTQRVAGATEMTLTLNYNVPTFLGFVGLGEIPLSFSRPVFVV